MCTYVCRQKYMIKINVRVHMSVLCGNTLICTYCSTSTWDRDKNVCRFTTIRQVGRQSSRQVDSTHHATDGSATLNFCIFTRHSCRHPPPLPPSPSAPVIASAILRRHSCLGCPRTKQTNKNFGLNRNKPKQDLL